MLKEIFEQPEVLLTCLSAYLPNTSSPSTRHPTPDTMRAGLSVHPHEQERSVKPAPTNRHLQNLPSPDQIHILGSGTSRHAGLVAQYWLEQIIGIPARVRSASEFLSAPLPLTADTLTLAVTQSGETADTLAAATQQKAAYSRLNPQLSKQLVGITNQPNSSLTKIVDRVLPTFAGEEVGVAATKTFTTQLAVMFCLTLELAQRSHSLSQERLSQLLPALQLLPTQIVKVLEQQEKSIQQIARSLTSTKSCIVLGQGINRAIALEGALKLKETTYIHAQGYAAGEFLHGPIALLEPTIPVIAIAPCDRTFEQVCTTIRKVKSHNVPIIGITTEAISTNLVQLFDYPIVLPQVDDLLSPFLTVIPLQLLAYYVAVEKGLNVDKPRNITKTVL